MKEGSALRTPFILQNRCPQQLFYSFYKIDAHSNYFTTIRSSEFCSVKSRVLFRKIDVKIARYLFCVIYIIYTQHVIVLVSRMVFFAVDALYRSIYLYIKKRRFVFRLTEKYGFSKRKMKRVWNSSMGD